jgi:hypothetical protein
MALLRDCFSEDGPNALSFKQQVDFLLTHWPDIQEIFSIEPAVAVNERLAQLRRERARRLFPKWYGD